MVGDLFSGINKILLYLQNYWGVGLLNSARFGACPPVLIILFRLCLPETKSYIERDAVRHANGSITSTFISEGRVALKRHWILLTYLVLLMAGFNFMVLLKLIIRRWPAELDLVSWFSRFISDDVEKSIQFLPKCCDSHSSRGKFRRIGWW